MNIGSGYNGQLTFLDSVSLMSFYIAIMNLNENLSQSDKQEMMDGLSKQTELLLQEIHSHLKEQDKKIDMILKELNHDNRRDI